MMTVRHGTGTTEDPGSLFDRLVESARKAAASTPSPERPTGLIRLPLSSQPSRKHLPDVQRTLDAIPAGVRTKIRECIAGQSAWPLVLCGDAGLGKTCAALCVLDYSGGEYFTVSDLCDKLNAAAMGFLEWNKDGRGGRMFPEMFRRAHLSLPPMLVLDELGLRSTVSDAHYEAVYRAVDLRFNKPFIAISNHTLAALEKIYDARTVSRLGAGTVVEMTGKDRRLA